MPTGSDEEPLSGGNASGRVIRVGDTVRKPWTASTPSVQAALALLPSHGIEVPTPLGRDRQGRQILEFIEGDVADNLPTLGPAELTRVGRMIRAIHDACAEIGQQLPELWNAGVQIPTENPDLLCHNDLAPWNLIIGDRWVFIDWDALGPSTRLWDLAYAAQSFANLNAGEPVQQAATRLRAIIDGYGADERLRRKLPQALSCRTRAMHDMLRSANETGQQPWSRMFEEGHGAHWHDASEYVAGHEDHWQEALQTD